MIHEGLFFVINIGMKKILIIDKSKPRKEIIRDIVKDAKEVLNYNRDNVLKRSLNGTLNFKEQEFYGILRRIIKQELPSIQEIMIMKNETFEKYLNM